MSSTPGDTTDEDGELPGDASGPQPLADFEGLYRAHARDVHRFALFLSGNPDLADDIVSETFIRLWSARRRVDLSTVRGYLFAIARNLFLQELRHARRDAELDERAAGAAPNPEQQPGPAADRPWMSGGELRVRGHEAIARVAARDITYRGANPAEHGRLCVTRFSALGILAASVLAVAGASARQQPVFRGGGEAVRVFATVLDGAGRLVTTLTQEDFEVRDDGKVQPITQFDNTPQPVRLIVMLDVSGSMEGNLPLLRDSAAQLFRRLRADDGARVGSFGREVVIDPTFTGNPDQLERQLPERIEPDAPTPLWRALDEAMTAFGKKGEEGEARRVILVLSDGKDSGQMDFRQPVASQAGVIDRARKDEVMVYAIGMRSRSRRPMQPGIGPGGLGAMLADDLPDPGLARVAEETGGGYTEVRLGDDLGAAFARVADELHSQYLLGYAPPRRDGKAHDIDVKVSRKGLKPRARTSYIAPKG